MTNETPVNDEICYDNGDYYEGQVLNSVPHGKGTMYYMDGTVREGYWRNGTAITRPTQDLKIPGMSSGSLLDDIVIGGKMFTVGFGYDNITIARAARVNPYIRGIRIKNETAVLISVPGSKYKDGTGWEMDDDDSSIFRYIGEGLRGDQRLNSDNGFLVNSIDNPLNRIYLFVRKHPNEYVFNGRVAVKRFEIVKGPDADGKTRDQYSFILMRV